MEIVIIGGATYGPQSSLLNLMITQQLGKIGPSKTESTCSILKHLFKSLKCFSHLEKCELFSNFYWVYSNSMSPCWHQQNVARTLRCYVCEFLLLRLLSPMVWWSFSIIKLSSLFLGINDTICFCIVYLNSAQKELSKIMVNTLHAIWAMDHQNLKCSISSQMPILEEYLFYVTWLWIFIVFIVDWKYFWENLHKCIENSVVAHLFLD